MLFWISNQQKIPMTNSRAYNYCALTVSSIKPTAVLKLSSLQNNSDPKQTKQHQQKKRLKSQNWISFSKSMLHTSVIHLPGKWNGTKLKVSARSCLDECSTIHFRKSVQVSAWEWDRPCCCCLSLRLFRLRAALPCLMIHLGTESHFQWSEIQGNDQK